ncbi:DNA-binding transcriptional LysR family regulator [Bradyrhizobium sp. JR3.5]
MDKLACLKAFAKVVETGSFSEAGRQLRLSRSAVSKYVAELEESLGVQLLNRTTRHASPNENGQLYFERALVVLSELDAADQAVAHLQSTPRGLLRINAPMSFGTIRLGPAIADFMTKYPEMQLQLVLSDDLLDPVQDGFDVTLRIAELESSSLIARKITPMPRVVCASPDYLKRHGTPHHPQDLRQSRLADLRFPAHRQSVEADRRGWGALDPARLVPMRQQRGGVARRRGQGKGRGVDPRVHRRRGTPAGTIEGDIERLLGAAAHVVRGLSADQTPVSEGAALHRFPRRTLRP